MTILTIRTDKPESEIGLYNDSRQIAYDTWIAHRQLATTIHERIKQLLTDNKKDWTDIAGIVVYKGPGSFTGLRIGSSVANALAYSLEIPIIGISSDGWIGNGVNSLLTNDDQKVVLPEYGAEAHITQPRK